MQSSPSFSSEKARNHRWRNDRYRRFLLDISEDGDTASNGLVTIDTGAQILTTTGDQIVVI